MSRQHSSALVAGVLAVGFLVMFLSSAIKGLYQVYFVDLAAHFGAVVFLGLIRGKCGTRARLPEYLDRLAEQLAPLAAYAAARPSASARFVPAGCHLRRSLPVTGSRPS